MIPLPHHRQFRRSLVVETLFIAGTRNEKTLLIAPTVFKLLDNPTEKDLGFNGSYGQVLLNSNHHLVKFFPRFVGGRMVSHPHREPKVLSFLLPLSRHASSPLLPTRRHLCLPSVTLPHHPNHPNPQLRAIPSQPPYLHTPR